MYAEMFDIQRNWKDEQGHQHFNIALTGIETHAEAIRKLFSMDGPFSLTFRVVNEGTMLTGAIDCKGPVFELVFERGVHPDGVWDVFIDIHEESGKSHELWHQRLFVQKDISRTAAEVAELAKKYAPIFIFSDDEQYFPVSLSGLLNAPELMASSQTVEIDTIFGEEEIPVSELGDFMRFNGHCDYLLDSTIFGLRKSVFTTIGQDRDATTVYYSYLEEPGTDRFFITYHMFYAFDTKTGVAKWTGIGPHIFDRESMVLVFDGDKEPDALVISGHLENQTIFLLEKLKIWSQGRISVPYLDQRTLKVNGHPVVAVAEGSHALYPTSGVYHISALAEIAGFLDSDVMTKEGWTTPELVPEQVAVPPSTPSDVLLQYDLLPLGLDQLCSRIDESATSHDPFNAYLVFSGYWVDVPGCTNARFPPFTRKISEIALWVDNAYHWDWNDLPESLHRNNDLIGEFLSSNVQRV